jgi:hypothetical protein
MASKGCVRIIRTITSGRVQEKIKFYIPEKQARTRKQMRASLRKQASNDSNATRRCARLLNKYFSEKDWFVGLDYSDDALAMITERAQLEYDKQLAAGQEAELADCIRTVAAHEVGLYLRRVNSALKKQNLEPIKYIAITSDMNGKTGEMVRVHHHIAITSEADAELLRKKWKHGGIHIDHIYRENDHSALAEYMMNQVRHIPDVKRYTPSRNMQLPVPKDRMVYTDAELQPAAGAVIVYRSEYVRGKPQYLRCILPDKSKGKKDRRRE